MTRTPRTLRIAAVPVGLVVSALVLFLVAGSASAAVTGRVVREASVRTDSWGAAAAASGAAPNGSPYVITWGVGAALGSHYFDVVNTGTLNLTAETWSAVNSKPSGNAPPTIGIDACVGATWNRLLGTCAGRVVRITATNQAEVPASVPIAAGAAVSVRAAPITLLNFPQTYTTTINVSVSRAQAQAASTDHS